MKRILITSIIVGAIAGLLVGGFHNLFTVPVMERAIVLEEERAATEAPSGEEEEGPSTDVSLGNQRIGMVFGTAIYGGIIGLLFAVGFVLLHRAAPGWSIVWVAVTVGFLGFWSVSLFPFIRYPLNPPGVGEETTLLARQLGQTLFMLVSAVAVGLAMDVFRRINRHYAAAAARSLRYGVILAAYACLALLMVFVFPGNTDPTPVPVDLLELFRTLTMVGQFLAWALLAVGVALALTWHERSTAGRVAEPSGAAGFAR